MAKIKLTVKDRKILSLIENRGRLTYSEIGKMIGCSKQVVKYRMDLLERKNIIQEYYAIVNDSKMGRKMYTIYFEFNSLTEEDEKKMLRCLKKDFRVLSYFSSLGKWDFVISSFGDSVDEVGKRFDEIFNSMSNKVKKRKITFLKEWIYLSSNIFSDLGSEEISTKVSNIEKIDELNIKLVDELLQNGRISFVTLSEKFNFTANGIKERVKRLEKMEVILGYRAKINYEKLGYLHCHFFIKISDKSELFFKKIKKFLIEEKGVESISRFSGDSDIDFRCNLKSVRDLYNLKRMIKNKFPKEINCIDELIIVRSAISHLKNG